jgi:hypothetical protein
MLTKETTMSDVATFLVRRYRLRTPGYSCQILPPNRYKELLDKGTLGKETDTYLKGFVDGWKMAKRR